MTIRPCLVRNFPILFKTASCFEAYIDDFIYLHAGKHINDAI